MLIFFGLLEYFIVKIAKIDFESICHMEYWEICLIIGIRLTQKGKQVVQNVSTIFIEKKSFFLRFFEIVSFLVGDVTRKLYELRLRRKLVN